MAERHIHGLSAWPRVSGSIVHKQSPCVPAAVVSLVSGQLLAVSAKSVGISYRQCISNQYLNLMIVLKKLPVKQSKYVVSGRRYVLNGRRYVLNGRRYVLNGRGYVLNGRRYVLNGRGYVLNG